MGHKDDRHKDPNGELWVNDKTGEKMEFNKGKPGATGEKVNDHWHYTPPGGDRGKDHFRPGEVIKKALQGAGSKIVQTVREHPVATAVVVGTCSCRSYNYDRRRYGTRSSAHSLGRA